MRKPTTPTHRPSNEIRSSVLAHVVGGAEAAGTTTKSQAEKRLEQQRKDLCDNWAG